MSYVCYQVIYGKETCLKCGCRPKCNIWTIAVFAALWTTRIHSRNSFRFSHWRCKNSSMYESCNTLTSPRIVSHLKVPTKYQLKLAKKECDSTFKAFYVLSKLPYLFTSTTYVLASRFNCAASTAIYVVWEW